MPVHRTSATPATFATLRTRIRRLVNDTSTERWSDAELDDALIYSLTWMYRQLSGMDGWGLADTTLTYTAGADSVSLTDALSGLDIIRVEDVNQADRPIEMDYVPLSKLEPNDHVNWTINSRPGTYRRYTFIDNAIAVRPNNDEISLKIYYVGGPFQVSGTSTDTHAYPVEHEELIAVSAANRLTRVFDETPMNMKMDQEKLEQEFLEDVKRFEGPRRVARTRKRKYL